MFPTLESKRAEDPDSQQEDMREKEKGWDERFTVGKGIPEYSPMKDRHVRSYRKGLQKRKDDADELSLLRNADSIAKQDKKTWSRRKHEAVAERLEADNVQQNGNQVRNNVRINMLVRDLEKAWLAEKIPDFYSFYFLEQIKGVSPERLEDLLTREIRLIRNKENHFVDISKSIEARETCLIEIRKVLTSLKLMRKKDPEDFEAKLLTLQEQISHLRKLTLFIIDKIKKWRDQLIGLSEGASAASSLSQNQNYENFTFLYGDQNYLMKILNDTNFFSNSILAESLQMATKNDPFLLRALKQERTSANARFMEVVDCEPDFKLRMTKALEYLAADKAEELRSKIMPVAIRPAVNERVNEVDRANKARAEQMLRERKSKAKAEVNYETDIEKVEALKQLERERERYERLERNQIRINAIKNIYEAKNRPRDNLGQKDVETDNELMLYNQKHVSSHLHNQSMPKLTKPENRPNKPRSNAVGQSQKKVERNPVSKEQDSEFESMLRKKEIAVLKQARTPQTMKLRDRLTSKKAMEDKDGIRELEKIVGGYSEGKLINAVKGLDTDIKTKIQQMKEEDAGLGADAAQPRRPPVSVAVLKQNSELIQELKGQIMAKLEKEAQEKERIKKTQREEEMRILDEMKNKLRREFEERINEEKAKRQAEREQLEKQLKAEDEKIAEQRKLELELIAKMTYQKQMREVERIKNETRIKEKELKRHLKEEHEKRLQFERNAKKEKLMLMEQLNKKALKDTLEEELKEELREKMRREAEAEAKVEGQRMFQQKAQVVEKQLEFLKIKEAMELDKLRHENEIRDNLLRQKLDEEARRQQDLEQLMKEKMEYEKRELENFATERRLQIERQAREGAKESLLEEMKAERMLQYEKDKREKEREIEEQVYREQMREKLERELRLDVIKKTKEQLQQREIKKKLISDQLERAQAKLEEQIINKPLDKAKIESEVRKEVIEKAIIDKKMEKEIAKEQLRSQFEKELLSSGIPDLYSQKPDFLLKDIEHYKDNDYLKGKLQDDHPRTSDLKPVAAATGMSRVTNLEQKLNESPSRAILNNGDNSIIHQHIRMPTEARSAVTDKDRSYNKLNDSQLTNERTRLGMTEEQYEIYKKKKRAVDALRDDNPHRVVRPIEELEDEQGEFHRIVVKGGESKKDKGRRQQVEEKRMLKERKSKHKEPSSEEEIRKKDKKKRKKQMEREPTDSEEAKNLSSDEDGWKEAKVKRTKRKRKQEEESDSSEEVVREKKRKAKAKEESEDQQDNGRRRSKKNRESANKIKKITQSNRKINTTKRSFETSDSEAAKQKKRKVKKISQSEEEQPEHSDDRRVVHYKRDEDSEEEIVALPKRRHSRAPSIQSQRVSDNVPVVNPTAAIQKAGEQFTIRVEAVDEEELDEYLGAHMQNLPPQQLVLQTLTRQELYRKLMNEVTFSTMIGEEEGKQVGLCVAYHDRNKQEARKFVIAHISTYHTEKLFDFVIAMCHYILRKDPCDEVELCLRYDETSQKQLEFSNDFNSKFDRYGAIFQKKLEDGKFERKYVMKRPFNLKCEVQLGTQSKHNFVNLFSISSTLLVSNMELVQIKQEKSISQSITPERELSYSIMISEIFRNCLSPEEAETLKNKVKEYLKLKELLVLIVMLEKKKVKLDELKLTEFSTMTELNMRLMSQGKELIRMVKDSGVAHNRIFYCELQQAFRLPFNFQTTTLPLDDGNAVHQINYFRMAAIPPHKLYTIKSSLYNTEMHVIPTENAKYKLFLMSATEYNEIKEPNNIDLFMYIRVFLKNVKSHSVANWKYVWVPEMVTKGNWAIREYRSFLDKDIYAMDNINISYRQFIPGTLIIQPEHKDLVITPPFIIGILSVTLEQVSEGSPLYVRLLESDSLKIVESEPLL